MHIALLTIFMSMCFQSFAGPWTAGQMPDGSYRYKYEEGHQKWTNYLHKLALRSEATKYSFTNASIAGSSDKWLSEKYDVIDAYPYVSGYSNFAPVITNITYTNLVNVSSNASGEAVATTMRITWQKLNLIDDKLIENLQHYVDTNAIASVGTVEDWFATPYKEWRWTLVRPDLWVCFGEPVQNPEDCNGWAYHPDEAFEWRYVDVDQTSLPMLSVSSVWKQLNLPISKTVDVYTNYTKQVYGYEVDQPQNYYVNFTYPIYYSTNFIYGFSVSPKIQTLTQLITRISYTPYEINEIKQSLVKKTDGDAVEVVASGVKKFMLEIPDMNNLAMQAEGFARSLNYITNSLNNSQTIINYNFPITNESSALFGSIEISGQFLTPDLNDHNKTTNFIIELPASVGGVSSNITMVLTGAVVYVQNASGYAEVEFRRTVTNYYSKDADIDNEKIWRDIFLKMPQWNEGVANVEIYTILTDGYSVIIPASQRYLLGNSGYDPLIERYNLWYLDLNDMSSTNMLNERERILSLMTHTQTSGEPSASGDLTLPTRHITRRNYPDSTSIFAGDGRTYPSIYTTGPYGDRQSEEEKDPCRFYGTKKSISESSSSTYRRIPPRTESSSTNYTIYGNYNSFLCSTGGHIFAGNDKRLNYFDWNNWLEYTNTSARMRSKLEDSSLYFEYKSLMSYFPQQISESIARSSHSEWRFGDKIRASSSYSELSQRLAELSPPKIQNTGFVFVTLTNLTTNISCEVNQYVSFYVSQGTNYQTNVVYRAKRNDGSRDYQYTNLTVNLPKPRNIFTDDQVVQFKKTKEYVQSASKQKTQDHVVFGVSDYGFGSIRPDVGWYSYIDVLSSDVNIGATYPIDDITGVGTRTWSQTETATSRIFYPLYFDAYVEIKKMIFLMKWDFDEIE